MSKPVKEMLRKELVKRFDGVTSAAIVGFTGIDTISTLNIRRRLHAKGIHMTVVKNSVARHAFKSVGMDAAIGLLDGPCAVAYGADSVVTVVRELMAIGKDNKKLVIKSAVLEGNVFAADQIEALSKYPNRAEAISNVVGCILSPGKKLAACLIGPGSKVASILKTVQENAEKAGAAPAPAADAPAATA